MNKEFYYHAISYASAVLGVVILSIHHTSALWQNQMMHCGYFDTTQKSNHSSFLKPTMVGGRRPFRLKFVLKVTQPLRKTPTLDRFPLTGLTSQP